MILLALCRIQQTNRLSLQFQQKSYTSTRSSSRISIISSSYQRRSISDSSNSTSSNGQWITGSLSGAKYVTKLVPPTSNNTKSTSTKYEARLLVSGPDASGLVASFSQLLYGLGCGIVECTSESSEEDEYDQNGIILKNTEHKLHSRMFFQRILFYYTNINSDRSLVENKSQSICQKFGMKYRLVSTF